MSKIVKTNAMRILDKMKIEYTPMNYESDDGKIDGVSVAQKIGRDPKYVYKTLVLQGHSKNIYVFLLPCAEELDLKKAAKTAGEKSIDMIPVKDILQHTGYIRGGCSPIGMKKHYKTFLNESAMDIDRIIVSGGKIGFQIELDTKNLVEVCDAEIAEFAVDR